MKKLKRQQDVGCNMRSLERLGGSCLGLKG